MGLSAEYLRADRGRPGTGIRSGAANGGCVRRPTGARHRRLHNGLPALDPTSGDVGYDMKFTFRGLYLMHVFVIFKSRIREARKRVDVDTGRRGAPPAGLV